MKKLNKFVLLVLIVVLLAGVFASPVSAKQPKRACIHIHGPNPQKLCYIIYCIPDTDVDGDGKDDFCTRISYQSKRTIKP